MAKEIHEQPEVISHTLGSFIDFADGRVHLPDLGIDPGADQQGLHLGLRHRLLRRPRRQVLARAVCAHPRRDRRRLRVPLSRAAAGEGRPGAVRHPVGRDGRHAGDAALLQVAGPAHRLHRQRAHLHHRARIGRRAADAGRARDRRRLHQGLHLPAERAGLPGDRARPRARHHQRGPGEGADARAGGGAAPRLDAAAQRGPATSGSRTSSPRRATCSISAAASAIPWRSRAR